MSCSHSTTDPAQRSQAAPTPAQLVPALKGIPRAMREAVLLAEQGRFATAPNPCVGAVLEKDGEIMAAGWHRHYGQAHAEVDCLNRARELGVDPTRCTLWVTLEPCNHQGKTPPCTRAILDAGIKNVRVGALDPNPDVAGGGVETLRQAGVNVETGLAETACRDLIADFLVWKFTDRPYVTLKLAATLDGRIATRTGHSQWISGEAARAEVHELRADMGAAGGAVLVGGQTFRADNPRLTARLSGKNVERQPLAVVITSRLPEPDADFYLLRERAAETFFFTGQDQAETDRAKALQDLGCRVWGLPFTGDGSKLALVQGLNRLRRELGVLYLLCEGGGGLGLSLLVNGLVDEFRLYTAPKLLGDNQAAPLFSGLKPERMDQALNLRLDRARLSGDDTMQMFRPVRATGPEKTGA